MLTSLDHFVELRIILFFDLFLVNILYLRYFLLPRVKDHRGIEVGMKFIPKSIVNHQVLWLLIWVVLTCFFHQLLLSHVIDHGMSMCISWTSHDYLLWIISDVASIKLLKVRWSIWKSTGRNDSASPFQVLLLDQLISPPLSLAALLLATLL